MTTHKAFLHRFGVKTRLEIGKEVLREPHIQRAMRLIREGDRALAELEAIERRIDERYR